MRLYLVKKTFNTDAYGIPESLRLSVSRLALNALPLRYTRHAMSEAVADKYGVLPATAFPRALSLVGWQLVEAEEVDGKLSKFVVRRPVDACRSLVLVVMVDGTVRTLWTNLNSDSHKTLDKSKFARE